MTEKGKENINNMKLVADELLKLLNTSNKKDDNETKQQRMEHINKLKQSGIPLELLNESKIMINKYFNDECSFDDIFKSFTILLNKKEEQKATEPKLSVTDIENTKQTNKIWQEYLEKQNKSIFEKIKDSSNKFDNTGGIFADIPDVNIKITKDDKNNLVFSTSDKPNIDMLKDLFLNNSAVDKKEENKEKVLSTEEQQRIFKDEFVYPNDLYNMLFQIGVFDKKTQDNHINVENKEIPSEVSFMTKILKDLYEQRLLHKKYKQDIIEAKTKVAIDNCINKNGKETEIQNKDTFGHTHCFKYPEYFQNCFDKQKEQKTNVKYNTNMIYGLNNRLTLLEYENKISKDNIFKQTSRIKEQNSTIDDIVERLDKLENKINDNVEFTDYLTKKFETLLNLLNIEEI